MRDTTPEAARVHAAVIRRRTPEQRLLAAVEFSDTCRDLALTRLSASHPDHSRRQLVVLWLSQAYPALQLPPARS
jgi:hypothetical protein